MATLSDEIGIEEGPQLSDAPADEVGADEKVIAEAAATIDAAAEKMAGTEPAQPGAGARFRKGLARVTKRVLLLAVIGGVGAGIYLGWPVVNDRVIRPIAANTASLGAIQDRVTATEARIGSIENEVGSLETAGSVVPERITALENQFAALAEMQGSFDGRVATVERDLSSMEREIAASSARIDTLEEVQRTIASDLDGATAELADEIAIVRSMELLSRTRLFLYQSNYGLAALDLSAARESLAAVGAGDEAVSDAVERIDRAVAALPDRPVAASEDVDIAWRILIDRAAGDPQDGSVEG